MTAFLIVVAYLLVGLLTSFPAIRIEWRHELRKDPDYEYPPGELVGTVGLWILLWPLVTLGYLGYLATTHFESAIGKSGSLLSKLYTPARARKERRNA